MTERNRHGGPTVFVLGPDAKCEMFPKNAKLVAGNPVKIKLLIMQSITVCSMHIQIDVDGRMPFMVHKNHVQSIWDEHQKHILWRNPDYGEEAK